MEQPIPLYWWETPFCSKHYSKGIIFLADILTNEGYPKSWLFFKDVGLNANERTANCQKKQQSSSSKLCMDHRNKMKVPKKQKKKERDYTYFKRLTKRENQLP